MMCDCTWEPVTQPKRNQTWSFNEMYGGTMALYGGEPVRRRTCTAENLYGGEPVRRRTCTAENLYGETCTARPVRRRTCTTDPMGTCSAENLYDRSNGDLYGGEPVRPIQWGPVRRRTCTTDPMGTCTAENLYDRSNGDLFGGDDVRRNYCPVRRHYDTMTLDSLGDSRIGGGQMISACRHGENPKSKFNLAVTPRFLPVSLQRAR